MELNGNSSNNTVFADEQGQHRLLARQLRSGAILPSALESSCRRQPGFERLERTSRDQRDRTTEESANGWIQNCNSTPFTAAAESSRRKKTIPLTWRLTVENYRAVNADRVLKREDKFTLDKLIAAAYDPTLAAFEKLIPALLVAFDNVQDSTTKQKKKS